MDLPDFADPGVLPFFTTALIVIIAAAIFGGKPERFGAAVLAFMPISQFLLYSTIASPVFGGVDWISVTVDVIGLVGFSIILFHADRIWTVGAFSMTLLSTVSHFARFNTDMLGFSYAQFKAVPTGLLILLILIGTACHQWRLRQRGEDRDWVPHKAYKRIREIA